jgi:hypothetical protein
MYESFADIPTHVQNIGDQILKQKKLANAKIKKN